MPWEETENYIRSGHGNPDDFEHLVTVDNQTERFGWLPEGVKALFGRKKDGSMGIQSYLFSKEQDWTMEKAKAWFTEHKQTIKESFSWLRKIPEDSHNLIYGVAVCEGLTKHKQHLYTRDELTRAARTLIGKPITIDHWDEDVNFHLPKEYEQEFKGISSHYPVGIVLRAEEEEGRIEWIGICENETLYNLIREGKVKGSSTYALAFDLEQVNGVKPIGIVYKDLSLLLKFNPASKGTWVKPLTNFKLGWITSNSIASPIPFSVPFSTVKDSLFVKEGEKTKEEELSMFKEKLAEHEIRIQKLEDLAKNLKEQEWTTEYINDLPDGAFAIILEGGEKDEQGKTVPRTLRKLPHHNAQGGLDREHVIAAMQALLGARGGVDTPTEAKKKAYAHLSAHYRELELEPPEYHEAIKEAQQDTQSSKENQTSDTQLKGDNPSETKQKDESARREEAGKEQKTSAESGQKEESKTTATEKLETRSPTTEENKDESKKEDEKPSTGKGAPKLDEVVGTEEAKLKIGGGTGKIEETKLEQRDQSQLQQNSQQGEQGKAIIQPIKVEVQTQIEKTKEEDLRSLAPSEVLRARYGRNRRS